MKNTSTIGRSNKHTLLPTSTFLECRVSFCPPPHVSQSPWLQQQLSGATIVLIFCLQVSSHNSCCTNLLRNRFFWKEKKMDKKLGGCLGKSVLPLCHTKRRPLFWDSTNVGKGKVLVQVQFKREKLGKQQKLPIAFTVAMWGFFSFWKARKLFKDVF